MLGIGGGTFSVPYFKALGLNLTSAIGTSAACGVPIAIFGTLGYIIAGINKDILPMMSLWLYIFASCYWSINYKYFFCKIWCRYCSLFISICFKKINGNLVFYCFNLYVFNMIIELSEFFNNPSLIELGPLKIQYYAITWLLSALLIYIFLKQHKIIKEIGLSKDDVNDMVFLYGLFFGAMCGGRIGYMLFYGTDQLVNDPLSLFYIWQGGLSFHGGLVGVDCCINNIL